MEDSMDIDPKDILDNPNQDPSGYAIQQLAMQVDRVIEAVNISVTRLNDLIAQVNALSTLVVEKELADDKELKVYMAKARDQIEKELEAAKENQANIQVFEILLNEYVDIHDKTPEA